jgi:tripartite-type tricarboxylate transporter receptor subunit TctC
METRARRSQLMRIVIAAAVAGLTFSPTNVPAQAKSSPPQSSDEPARAQQYPDRPVRLVVPLAPGGGADILARIVGQKMTQSFGQQVVIDNRPGAGTIIGTEIVAKSAPDGYTLALVIPAHAINVSLFGKLPFDPIKDFAAVTLCASAPYILVVHPSVPVKTVKDLIDLARSKPGQLNYASAGNGTSPHLAAELFKTMTKVNITGVPYNGGGAALAATFSGEVQMTFGVVAISLPHLKTGKLVGLAVTSEERMKLAPELPTVAEAGVPGYEAITWYGVLAPARTPVAIISKLDRELKRILQLADVQERFATLGFQPSPSATPRKFADYIEAEIPKWAKVVKDARIRPD